MKQGHILSCELFKMDGQSCRTRTHELRNYFRISQSFLLSVLFDHEQTVIAKTEDDLQGTECAHIISKK
jgi:hypothetical protein